MLLTDFSFLQKQVLEVRARMKELEEKLSNATQRNQDVEQEVSVRCLFSKACRRLFAIIGGSENVSLEFLFFFFWPVRL